MSKFEANNSDSEKLQVSSVENVNSAEEQSEKVENVVETAEDLKLKVDIAQQELASAYESLDRINGQKSKLAGVREKLGLSNESDESVNQDYEKVQQQIVAAKENFRSTFGGFGKQLAQEKFEGEGALTNEQVVTALYSEKLIETDQVDENGEQVSRTLAQEYESRLDTVKEKTPTQKGIAAKLWETYNNIPKSKKVIAGTIMAAGVGAMTGGASVAMVAGANKLTKMLFAGAAAAGADTLLKKHMDRRDKKNQTTDADFAKKAENIAQEAFENAKNSEDGVEGMLEGTEKKMQVFEEMFKHQKSKNKVRVAAAIIVGGAVGGGVFDAEAAHASSGIQSGSFDFGGGSAMNSTVEVPISNEIPTSRVPENFTAVEDDGWDIPKDKTMAEGLQRSSGVIPGEDGKTLEEDIRPKGKEDVVSEIQIDSESQLNVDEPEVVYTNNSAENTAILEEQTAEVVQATNDGNFAEGFLANEVRSLENANAGLVIMQNSNDSVLNIIKVEIGLPKNESMMAYLNRFSEDGKHELTFEQKKHLIELV